MILTSVSVVILLFPAFFLAEVEIVDVGEEEEDRLEIENLTEIRAHFPRLPDVPVGGRQLILFSKNVSNFEIELLESDRVGPELGELDAILTYGQVDDEEDLEDSSVLEGEHFEGKSRTVALFNLIQALGIINSRREKTF